MSAVGIVSSETMENLGPDVEEVIVEEEGLNGDNDDVITPPCDPPVTVRETAESTVRSITPTERSLTESIGTITCLRHCIGAIPVHCIGGTF